LGFVGCIRVLLRRRRFNVFCGWDYFRWVVVSLLNRVFSGGGEWRENVVEVVVVIVI
jgi:hypothetical protein